MEGRGRDPGEGPAQDLLLAQRLHDDFAADRAGTRFGEHAADTDLAPKLQQRLVGGLGDGDIMPPTTDLPEFLSETEFERRFGGITAPEYKQLIADIDRRIAGLPLYR